MTRSSRSRKRLWFLRIAALSFAPILLLMLEAGLRVFHFGYDTAFTQQADVAGVTCHVPNRDFGLRFFPPSLNRAPTQFALPVDKDENEFRIILLGASAAQGVPNHTFGFSRILEVQLRHLHPKTQFRILNTGVTAINSHVVREIAQDCAELAPDLFIVYLGNNEVVGPFGAGTVFSPLTRQLATIRASLWFKETRIGQLVGRAAATTFPQDVPPSWGGMEMFLDRQVRHDAADLQQVHRHFERNLRAICLRAAARGIPVLLSTVAVNTRHSPPFASQHGLGLLAEQQTVWEDLYQRGVQQETNRQYSIAIGTYEQALAIDDAYAELHFRLANCYVQSNEIEKARTHFNLAKEYDTLRFRADDTINSIIRSTAKSLTGVTLVDMEEVVLRDSQHQLPGGQHFYEHVHFNFVGNCLTAATLADAIRETLPGRFTTIDMEVPALLDIDACKARMAFTPWDECQDARRLVNDYLKRPPFTNQAYHERTIKGLEKRIRQRCDSISPAALQQMDADYTAAIAARDEDVWLRFNYATFRMKALQDHQSAEAHLKYVLQQLPNNPMALANLGVAQLGQQATAKAISNFRSALRIKPGMLVAHVNLAKAYFADKQLDAAVGEYGKALSLSPESAVLHRDMAVVLMEKKEFPQAIEHLQTATKNQPDYFDAYHMLGGAYVSVHQTAKAVANYRKAIAIKPDFVPGYNNLGAIHFRQADYDKAIEYFRKALEYRPDFAPTYFNLGDAYRAKGQDHLALDAFRKAVRFDPQFQPAHVHIVNLLKQIGREQEALEYERKLRHVAPRKPTTE